MPPAPDALAFDDVVIDFAGRRLSRGGRDQPLEPKAFAVLALLAASPGTVFTRDEILDAIWGHRHVTQSVLNRIMSLLRQALGEDAQHPRLLHTVYGVGYRFDLPAAPSPGVAGAPAADPVDAGVDARRRASRKPRATWPIVTAVLLVAMAAVWWGRTSGDGRPAPATPAATVANVPSLAVLPFADLSRARDQEYFADGLAEDILNQLARSPSLRVVGRTSSFTFKGKAGDLRAIGRTLGVDHLLEGSVRRDGDRLRVTAQLVRAADGTHLWSKAYSRRIEDVFAVQEELSRDVAQALSVTLDVARFNREQGGTTHVEAYDRLLRWRGSLLRGELDFVHDRERLQLAREMVALDPKCVLCRDLLARSLDSLALELGEARGGSLRDEARAVRAEIARTAPDSWVGRLVRADMLWRAGRRAEAIALARQVADSGPPTKERVWDYAYMIYAVGHLEEAIVLVERVRAVEPLALYLSRDLQYDYTAARRYEEAEAEYRRARTLEGSQLSPDYLAFFRQLAGKRPGALEDLRTLHARLLGRDREFDTPFFRDLGTVLDDRAAMLALVRQALADDAYGGGAGAAYVWTSVADALGDADLAVAAMRRDLAGWDGFEQGAMAPPPYVALWNAPYSDVRAHPDFRKLLVETGVVAYWRQTGRWGDGCGPVGADDFRCR
ncbi:winged helix-turn-helix domain-containing protein [Pseudoxanthomonas sp. 10H]|uniref:winged helix-turn-helix domain-containing protein n=1 Tax=Pseudoxanthomonas sp. 10H TaxID=3242729 RepID=UPI003557D945